jgi:TolA-binding protein
MKYYRDVVDETNTPTAARAQFQLGQCLVAVQDYRKAILELLQVAAKYAYPEWTSKAILQVAGCFEAMEDLENAKKYYREVVKDFPDRAEAKLARERLSQL